MQKISKWGGLLCALCTLWTSPSLSQGIAGPYLAARQASIQADFQEAAHYFAKSLRRDRKNTTLAENLLFSDLALGNFERAVPRAADMVKAGLDSRIAQLTNLAQIAQQNDLGKLRKILAKETGLGGLVDGLARAWLDLAQGELSVGFAKFEALLGSPATDAAVLYHQALGLGYIGRCAQAEKILSDLANKGWRLPLRGQWAQIQCLSQNDAFDKASAILSSLTLDPKAPRMVQAQAQIAARKPLKFQEINSFKEALGEIYFSIAGLLPSESAADYALIYARLASYLRPEDAQSKLLSAELLEELEQYDLAIATYADVSKENGAYYAAVLGHADALRRADQMSASIALLKTLTQTHPHLADVEISYADALRQDEAFKKAIKAYDRAAGLLKDQENEVPWFVFYARGIAYERAKQWPQAEQDFRAALALNPDQPQVLNYLGYSLVEKRIKLDEALSMIEKAVALRSDSGYIVDSLGWVMFRLGRFDEAVPHMERAAELLPIDPIVNDHLGDVYWSVGRRIEAMFQWRRALSFDPEESEAARIRKKLERGLDEVMREEGQEVPWGAPQDA